MILFINLLLFLIFTTAFLASCVAGYRILSPFDRIGGFIGGFTCGIAQLVFVVQILSLFKGVTGLGVAATMAFISFVLWRISFRLPRPPSLQKQDQFSILIAFISNNHIYAFVLGISFVLLIGITVIGWFLHPYGDNYHFSRPLYWVQNQSIAPFMAENFRISSFAPGADILFLPGYLFFSTIKSNLLVSIPAMFGCMLAIWCLARRIGFSEQNSFVAALCSMGFSPFTQGIIRGGQDLLLPAMFVGGSFIFLFEAADRRKEGKASAFPLAVSIFLFAMAAGFKNAVILAVPGYLIAVCIIFIPRYLFEWKSVRSCLIGGLLGILLSGALWNYAMNVSFYGSLTGSSYSTSGHVAPLNPRAMWTQVVRGMTTLGDFTAPLPQQIQSLQKTFNNAIIRLSGAEKQLDGEVPGSFRSYDPGGSMSRKGLGLLGIPLIISVLVSFVIAFRGKYWNSETNRRIFALIVFFIIGFIVLHAFVRWAEIGRFRLSHAIILPVLCLIPVILINNLLRAGFVLLSWMNIGLISIIFLSFTLRKFPDPKHPLLAKIENLSPDRKTLIDKVYTNGTVVPFQLKLDYSTQEILKDIADNEISNSSTIGFISNINSLDSYVFGKHMRHKVYPITEKSDLSDLPIDVQYLLIEHDTPKWTESLLHGWKPLIIYKKGSDQLSALWFRDE